MSVLKLSLTKASAIVALLATASLGLAACGGNSDDGAASSSAPAADAVVSDAVAATESAASEAPTAEAGAPGEPQRGGVVVYGTSGGPGNGGLDPFLATVYGSTAIFAQLYEPLIAKNDSGEFEPWLATEWTQVDEVTYDFTIRDGVKFADGSDLTVDDVIWTFTYAKENSPQSKVGLLDNLVSLTKTGENQIEFKFSAPNPGFLSGISDRSYGFFIVDQQWYEAADETQRQTESNGTGPFTLDSWTQGVEVKLVRNENYWDAPKPYLDGITFTEVGDESSILALVQQGQADAAWFWESQLAAQAEQAGFTLGDLQQTSTRFFFIDPNGGDGVLKDLAVRQAISKAIDREEVVTLGTQGRGAVTFTTPPAFKDLVQPSDATPNFAYDPDGAKALLAEAGIENPTVTLSYDATTADEPALVLIQDQLSRVGINLVLNPIPYELIQAVFTTGDAYPSELILVQDVIGSDPSSAFGWWLATGSNVDRWGDDPQAKEAKDLLTALDVNPDPVERTAQINQLNTIVSEQVLTFTPFVTPLDYQVWSSKVQGYTTDPGDSRYHWRDAWLAE